MSRKLLFLWGFLLILAGSTSGALFTGEYFDDSINLQYNRARWYAPQQGRFVSIDQLPSETIQPNSLNRYLYASADPILRIDPSGLFDFGELQTVLADIGRSAKASIGSYRIVFQKTGCLLIEGIAAEVIVNGVYIFLDELTGLPYIGKTKGNIDKRLAQHVSTYAKNGARIVGETLAKFHVVGGAAELQIIEQLIIDLVSAAGKVSNVNRALSETRIDKKVLRERLAKIKLCK